MSLRPVIIVFVDGNRCEMLGGNVVELRIFEANSEMAEVLSAPGLMLGC